MKKKEKEKGGEMTAGEIEKGREWTEWGRHGEREKRGEERKLVQNGCNYFPAIRYHLIKYLQQNYIYMMNGTVWMKVRNGPSADINR